MKKNIKSPPLFTIQCYEDRVTSLPIKKAAKSQNNQIELKNDTQLHNKQDYVKKPPPPPPMPLTNGHHNGNQNKTDTNNLDETDVAKIPNLRKLETLNRLPTPDYNNKKDFSVQIKTNSLRDQNVEIKSLESYKLNNPLNVTPKPPSNYFIKAPNGPDTMKKRPVSVTIGEYVNNIGRKEPSKLDFLNGDNNGRRITDDEPITSRLQSELALTLSRSNLRKKTEALADGGR